MARVQYMPFSSNGGSPFVLFKRSSTGDLIPHAVLFTAGKGWLNYSLWAAEVRQFKLKLGDTMSSSVGQVEKVLPSKKLFQTSL